MKRQFNIRFFAIFTVVCLLIGGGAAFAHSYQTRRHADYLVKRGHEAEEKGELDKAADYYVKYLAFRPDDAAARGRFGMIQAKRAVTPKQKLAAFLTLERALRDDASLKEVRRKAIDVAIDIERFADARVNVEALLGASPSDPELMELLGRCEEDAGRIPEAIVQYDLVVTKSPERVKVYDRLATLYSRQNRKDLADKAMAQLIANNPDSIQARLIRFHYSRALGNLAAAREDLTVAQRATDPGESAAEIYLALADLALAERNFVEARKHLVRGRQLPKKDLRFTLGLARLDLTEGRRAEALGILKEFTGTTNDDPSEVWAIADLMIDANETDLAEKLVNDLKGKVQTVALDYLTARIKMRRGELISAVRIFERCRVEFIRSPVEALQTELMLASCFERLGQVDQRLTACNKALQIDRSSVPARHALASALLATGKTDDAVRELQSLRERRPSVRSEIARIRLWQARLLASGDAGRKILLDSAASELDGAPDDQKTRADYQVVRVELLIATGRRAEAQKSLEAARDKNPEEAQYWQILALIAAADGKPADGLAVLQAAGEKLGDRVELKLSRIYLMLQDKQAPAAFRPLEAGIDKLPEEDRDRLLMALADAYGRSGAPEDAERLLRKLAGYRPNDPVVLTRLFDILAPKGSPEKLGEIADKLRSAEGEEGVEWRFADAFRHWLLYRNDRSLSSSLIIAQKRLEEAGKLRAGWYRVPLLEAEIEDGNGQIETAIEKYQAAIRLGANSPEVVRRAVQLLVLRRRYDEARDQLNAARARSAAQPADLVKSLDKAAVELALLRNDTNERTFELAEKSVQADSTEYRDHLWRGQVYSSSNREKEAEAAFRRAVELGPTAPETWGSLVVFLARSGRAVEANLEIVNAEKAIPAEKRSRALAACYEAVGNRAEAEKSYAALVQESPNDLGVLRSQATFYVSVGEIDKAAPILRRVIDASAAGSDSRRWARRSLALTLVASGDFGRGTEAIGLVEANLKDKPNSPEDLRARAMILASRPGGRQQSIKELEDSYAVILPSPQEEFMLARLYELDGNWLRAKERLESLLSKPGGRNPAFYAHFIRALLKREDLSAAGTWFNRLAAVESSSQSPFVVEMKARILTKQGKKSEAANLLKTFAGAIYQDKKNPNVFRDVGRLLAELKLTVDAEELLRQYVKEAEPKSPVAVLVLAEFLARDDRVGEAIQLCSKYLKTAGPELTALIAVSAVRLGKANAGDYTAASAVIDEAIRQKPASIDLKISLAEFRDAQGRYPEAIESYRAILQRDPKNDTALNNLAWLLAFQDGKAAEALGFIDSAIQVAGPQPNLLDTRGVILTTLGRTDEAVATLGESVVQSRSPESHYHLALAHHKAKQALEAQRAMRQAKEAGFTKKYLHPLEIKAYDEFVKAIGEE